ncbi:hypothetical protein ARMSODRAFT_1085404 [Armillaria solidipes]|uniref:Uncharacterized protein n=1 Tax=Armillaria solidipes TaxID=1076256 RepID=A0A2H3BV86_9AGAR|nr:hypothetical protein ARMSODRAFT_1085404 [Armillaria solidipes]
MSADRDIPATTTIHYTGAFFFRIPVVWRAPISTAVLIKRIATVLNMNVSTRTDYVGIEEGEPRNIGSQALKKQYL